jgi:hypothetical protein
VTLQQVLLFGDGSAGSGALTWNPADKGSDVTLSNGNLTAASGAAQSGVRGTRSRASGKRYFEFTIDTKSAASNAPGVGVMTSGVSMTSGAGIWFSASTGCCVYPAPTAFSNNGSPIDLGVAYNVGDNWGIAIDIDTGMFWAHRGGTYVNSGNPAAGTNPIITLNTGLTLFPGYRGADAQVTARFATASWITGAPSGFTEF